MAAIIEVSSHVSVNGLFSNFSHPSYKTNKLNPEDKTF